MAYDGLNRVEIPRQGHTKSDMKKRTHLLLCWLLSLTLSGLPLSSLALDIRTAGSDSAHCEHTLEAAGIADSSSPVMAAGGSMACCDDCQDACRCDVVTGCSGHAAQSLGAIILPGLANPEILPLHFRMKPAERLHSRPIEPGFIPPIV